MIDPKVAAFLEAGNLSDYQNRFQGTFKMLKFPHRLKDRLSPLNFFPTRHSIPYLRDK